MPSFTPDSALDLLFDPSLIPDEVRKVLAEGLHVSAILTWSCQTAEFSRLAAPTVLY